MREQANTNPMCQESAERLRAVFPKGSTVYTVLRKVSRGYTSREIGTLAIFAGLDGAIQVRSLDYSVSKLLELKLNKHCDGVVIKGCGSDMGFELVDKLARELYDDPNALKHKWI